MKMKKEYIKPVLKVVKIQTTSLFASSPYNNVMTTGFNEGEALIGIGEDDFPTTGIVWDDAW